MSLQCFKYNSRVFKINNNCEQNLEKNSGIGNDIIVDLMFSHFLCKLWQSH